MADIKKIVYGSTEYDIVDAGARTLISALESYTEYLGVTTTALTDGATTNPITVGGESVTAKKGNIANYGSKEFIFNGTTWQEFGDLSGLGELAFADSVTASYTPAGTMTDPTISIGGTASAAAQTATVGGTASAAAQTATVGGTASAAAQSISLTSTEKSIPNVTSVGSMPTFSYANETLTITDGTAPTLGTAITVNDVTAATASASSVDLTSVTVTNQASSVDLTSVTVTNQASDVSLASVTATATGTAFAGTAATITSTVPTP